MIFIVGCNNDMAVDRNVYFAFAFALILAVTKGLLLQLEVRKVVCRYVINTTTNFICNISIMLITPLMLYLANLMYPCK
jgi:hypothetical protein